MILAGHGDRGTRALELDMRPSLAQVRALKEREPGTILIFAVGENYEAYAEDADAISLLMGLRVTSVDEGDFDRNVVSLPEDRLEEALGLIVRAGKRAGVCEPVTVTKPKPANVERIVTPYDPALG